MTAIQKIEFMLDSISSELSKKDVIKSKREELIEKEEIYMDKLRRKLQIDTN